MPPINNLMWINKTSDSKSLSRSTGTEKKRIFSHVQQGPPKGQDATNAAMTIHKWWAIDETEASSSKTPSRTQSPAANSGRRRDSKRRAGVSPNPTIPIRLVEAYQAHQTSAIPGQLDVDPEVLINVESVTQSYMAKVMMFFGTMYTKQMFSSQVVAGNALSHTLSIAAKSPVARYALVCATASSMFLMGDTDASHQEHSMYFKGLALNRLRKAVSAGAAQSAPGSAIFVVAMLLWTELVQGDLDHVSAHVSGLHQILRMVNFGEQISLSEAPAIYGTSNLCSAMLRTTPLPLPTTLTRYSIQKDIDDYVAQQADIYSSLCGNGFFDAENAQLLGPEILRLAARQQARQSFHDSGRFKELKLGHPDNEGLGVESMSVDYQLLALRYNENGSPLTSVQHAVRLSIFLLSQPMAAQMSPASALCRALCQQFYEWIEDSDIDGLWAPHYELLLWVLVRVACYSEKGERWNWLMDKIRQLFVILEVTSQAELHWILEKYLWVKDLFGETLVRIWNDADIMLGLDLVEELD